MPFLPGLSSSNRNSATSPISVLILGAATDGPLGEPHWFTSPDSAIYAYGGLALGRFLPSPSASSATLPVGFIPDDPSLTLGTQTWIYHFDPSTNRAQVYPGLGNWQASGLPVTLTFDPIGYDASNAVFDGGLFVHTAGAAAGGNQSLLLPLISAITESQFSNAPGVRPIGACRVGTSWLPSESAQTPVTFLTGIGTGTTLLQCAEIGDGTQGDLYLSTSVTVYPNRLVLDSGNLPLPYSRCTYTYTNFPTWDSLWQTVQSDFLNGKHPFRIISRPTAGDPRSTAVPGSGYVGNESPVVFAPTYADPGFPAPDLTTAEAWAEIFEKEDLPLDSAAFVCPSGLSGQALASDTASALRLFTSLQSYATANEENPDVLLVVPWSLVPPATGSAYSSASDITSYQVLANALGPELAHRLLIFWGTASQYNIPMNADRSPRIIPVVHAVMGALVREGERTLGVGRNLLHPELQSLRLTGVPNILITNAAAPPAPTTPQSVPGPSDLSSLAASSLAPLTRSVGDRWVIHGPILLGDGSPLRQLLVQTALREDCLLVLEPFLGRTNSAKTRSDIQTAITSLQTRATSSLGAISDLIAYYQLTLLYDPSVPISTWNAIEIQGNVSLYGETTSISFQLKLSL